MTTNENYLTSGLNIIQIGLNNLYSTANDASDAINAMYQSTGQSIANSVLLNSLYNSASSFSFNDFVATTSSASSSYFYTLSNSAKSIATISNSPTSSILLGNIAIHK